MPKLIAYRKIIDAITTHTLLPPAAAQGGEQVMFELAELPDGRTVVVLADGHDLPDQPPRIASSVEVLPQPLPDELRETIKMHSPRVRLIGAEMIEQIRSLYSVDDEMYFARLGVGAATGLYQPTQKELGELQSFGAFVEGVRAWGKAQRSKLGL